MSDSIDSLKTYVQLAKKKLEMDAKGQGGVGGIMGLLFIVVLIGFSAFLIQNLLSSPGVGIYTGTWTVLDTIWPFAAIVTVLIFVYGLYLNVAR